jgi:glyoxylase-like metal-dependent hydrolase (beta-lactamase superfamily II)
MKLFSIQSGMFKLDGGAMFGVVPKTMWQKLNPPDEDNLCTWSMRCLLIDTGNRRILIDTGLGDKQDDKFRSHFKPHGQFTLLDSLKQASYLPSDITDVFITHMHFDHVGGAIMSNADGTYSPTFPNARYWTNKIHLDWALNPNEREKASFLKENIMPLVDQQLLEFIDPEPDKFTPWFDGIDVLPVFGHTEAMMLLRIPFHNTHVYYAADLIPSSFHIPMPYIMSYDLRPLETLKEKKYFLNDVLEKNGVIFFEHDPLFECGKLNFLPNGRIGLEKNMKLSDI